MILPILLAASVDPAQAQAHAPYEPPHWKTVLFGGYSSVNVKPGSNLDRLSLNGWTASVTSYHVFRRWGLAAEFGGNQKAGNSQRSYLFGGTFRALERKRFALTGRILAGGTRWAPRAEEVGAYRRQTAFTFGFGQAIDFKLSENLVLRIQPDLRFARLQDEAGASKISFQRPFSVGLAYQFGRR